MLKISSIGSHHPITELNNPRGELLLVTAATDFVYNISKTSHCPSTKCYIEGRANEFMFTTKLLKNKSNQQHYGEKEKKITRTFQELAQVSS